MDMLQISLALPLEQQVRISEWPALFSSENILDFGIIAFLFLFDKYYLIMEDSSRDLQINCAINFYFCLYLMLHAFTVRFDVIGNLKKFLVFG